MIHGECNPQHRSNMKYCHTVFAPVQKADSHSKGKRKACNFTEYSSMAMSALQEGNAMYSCSLATVLCKSKAAMHSVSERAGGEGDGGYSTWPTYCMSRDIHDDQNWHASCQTSQIPHACTGMSATPFRQLLSCCRC